MGEVRILNPSNECRTASTSRKREPERPNNLSSLTLDKNWQDVLLTSSRNAEGGMAI